MAKYVGQIDPPRVAWKIEASGAGRLCKFIIKSDVPAHELVDEDKDFLEAWVQDLEKTLLGEGPDDSDVYGIYILKDGSVFIGFEVPSSFMFSYYFFSPVIPRENLVITIEVYCESMKLINRFKIRYDATTELIEEWPGPATIIPLEVDRKLRFDPVWP